MTASLRIENPEDVDVFLEFGMTVAEIKQLLAIIPEPPGNHTIYKFRNLLSEIVAKVEKHHHAVVTQNTVL